MRMKTGPDLSYRSWKGVSRDNRPGVEMQAWTPMCIVVAHASRFTLYTGCQHVVDIGSMVVVGTVRIVCPSCGRWSEGIAPPYLSIEVVYCMLTDKTPPIYS